MTDKEIVSWFLDYQGCDTELHEQFIRYCDSMDPNWIMGPWNENDMSRARNFFKTVTELEKVIYGLR